MNLTLRKRVTEDVLDTHPTRERVTKGALDTPFPSTSNTHVAQDTVMHHVTTNYLMAAFHYIVHATVGYKTGVMLPIRAVLDTGLLTTSYDVTPFPTNGRHMSWRTRRSPTWGT